MSTPTVDRILVAPKSYVVNSDRSYRVHKVANLPEREILNFADPQFSQFGGPTCEEEQCDSLCGGPTGDKNVSYE